MSELLILPSLKTQLSNQILESSMDDCILPESFKQNFTEFGEYHIEKYNKYTTKVSSKKSTLIIPNQWFYIAGVCCKYHLELVKYKSKLTDYGITDEMFEACHPSKDNKSISEDEKTLEVCKQKAKKFLSNYEGEDKELLISFLWDYDSWGGGKNIKRSNDFTESPVLNIANTINASSGLIGSITKAFALRQDVAELLWSSTEWNKIYNESPNSNIITSKQLTTPLTSSPTYHPYLHAIRTKPFLLLAGISGTGKSRIVRELAFKSCPAYLQDKDGTTPGNYCMIEVKPNWHDSTELLGYYSNLREKYLFTKFVKFLVKAKMYPDVPFFVCLDEMNLAPVEQYFAEMLSVLETRKTVGGTIKTGAVIGAEHFKALEILNNTTPQLSQTLSDQDIYFKLHEINNKEGVGEVGAHIDETVAGRHDLTTEGLTLPDNVVIIGTVNMDDTTHQFSRKVIDRAMTIEMNGGRLKEMFGGSRRLSYTADEAEQQKWQHAFRQRYVSADEVLDAHADKADALKDLLPKKLEDINAALKGTPFEVSYRVLNELAIMVGVMADDAPEENLETIADRALDRILLMKVLPRIEGDSDMFNLKTPRDVNGVTCRNRLEWLRELAPAIKTNEEEGEKEQTGHRQTAREKIEEMIERLENQEFTRFWP